MAVTTQFTVKPAEKGTAKVTASFTDEAGTAVSPNGGTLTWTLTDQRGTVINSRSAVAISSSSTVNVVLSGDDLSLALGDPIRVITFECLYNSTLGSNLPLKIQGIFTIENLYAVS